MAEIIVLHLNGADGSTTFTDVGSLGSTWAGTSAQITTAQSKFGGASATTTANAGRIQSSSAPIPVTGSWTVEFWVRFNDLTSSPTLLDARNGSAISFALSKAGTGFDNKIYLSLSSSGLGYNISNVGGTKNNYVTGQWYHIALCRDSTAGKYFVYVDGVLDQTVTTATNVVANAELAIGGSVNGAGDGIVGHWIDEFIARDVAQYPGGTTFTPPTTEFSNDLIFTGSGGVTAGGIAGVEPGELAFVASGGTTAGGVAPFSYEPAFFASGGATVGGTATVSADAASTSVATINGLSVVGAIGQDAAISGSISLRGLSASIDAINGGFTTGDCTINALGVVAYDAAGFDLELNGMSVAAVGQSGASGDTVILLTGLSVAGVASGHILASGSFELNLMGVTARLLSEGRGTVSVELPPLSVAGSGYAGQVGTAQGTIGSLTVAAAGWPAVTYSGVATISALSVDGMLDAVVHTVFKTIVMNLELGGDSITEYDGFDFNSYAVFNGLRLAAGDAGLFAIGGDTDDGEHIDARFLGGITDFDSDVQIQCPYAYVTYRCDGHTVIVTRTGQATERRNLAEWSQETTLHRKRVQLDNAPKALEWQFGMENVEGSNFAVSQLSVLPVRTDRRV